MPDNSVPLDLTSRNTAADRLDDLLRLFPEIRTEGGKIDFDRLKLALGESVDLGKERYGMNWPGKAECFKAIQSPSLGTLLPAPQDSVNFDTTENMIIEGDNLEVLKLLQKSYMGKVKMIYIDPPYNTGNDFIYPDNYSESLQTYLEYTGQVDAHGRRFGTNTDADGRFHSKWMNMMYPRLYLARNLLRDDGVVFISIDGHEVDNLKKICGEIFGEENFVCSFTWEKRYSPPPDTKEVGYVTEEIVFLKKSSSFEMGILPLEEDQVARYKNPDNDPRGPWKPMDYTCRYTADERPNLYYPVINPNTNEMIWPKKTRVWSSSREVHDQNMRENRIWWGSDGSGTTPALKNFLSEIRQGMMPMTLLKHQTVGNTDEATKELRELLPDLKFTPKPTRLIRHLMQIASLKEGDIVLDFFAGTGTTAHSILDENVVNAGTKSFILVQLPELVETKEFASVFDITKERVRRVIKRIETKQEGKLDLAETGQQDLGFKVFKLAPSNFTTWDAQSAKNADALASQLDLHIDHIRLGRQPHDILYEVILKSGYPLTTPVEALTIEGKKVFSVAEGGFLICLEEGLNLDLIKAMASREPARVVCLDTGFKDNDELKTNAVQTFKSKNIVFKTV